VCKTAVDFSMVPFAALAQGKSVRRRIKSDFLLPDHHDESIFIQDGELIHCRLPVVCCATSIRRYIS
jgi:hypothetical protein